jgi:hypothetical protein
MNVTEIAMLLIYLTIAAAPLFLYGHFPRLLYDFGQIPKGFVLS